MKRIILLAIGIVLIASTTWAAPFLVCDPQPGVVTYKLTGPPWVPLTIPAQGDGSLRLDVATASVGTNSLTVAACISDAVWGETCSSTVPFVFTRPAVATTPLNIRLIP